MLDHAELGRPSEDAYNTPMILAWEMVACFRENAFSAVLVLSVGFLLNLAL